MSARITLNHQAMARLLKSAEVEDALTAVAERIEGAALEQNVQVDTGDVRGPMPYEIVSAPSQTRARVYVVAAHPAGLAAEAKYGTLAKALDAGK